MGLRTLGGLELRGNEFGQQQALVLLAFLGIEGPQPRSHLAELFWPSAKTPRNNLSSAITRIRAVDRDLIEGDPSTVSASVEVDATLLVEHRRSGDPERAVALYDGRFLDGVDLARLPVELEEWAIDQRALLAATARDAAVELAVEADRRADTATAVHFAERAVTIGADAIADVEQIVLLARLLSAGRSALFHRVTQEARELGIDLPAFDPPDRSGRSPARPVDTEPDGGTSADTGRQLLASDDFFGRSEELQQVRESLAGAAPVVIAGLGGAGKSRLASHAAWLLADAFGPTLWVDLEQVTESGQLTEAIASVALPDHEPPEDLDGLASAIASRRAVLVLDNFEHLAGDVVAIEPLVRECPEVSVVITSRAQLALDGAAVLTIGGLPARSDDGKAPGAAVQLLRSALARRGHDRDLSAVDDDLAVEICSMLDGLPLAIELAAGWASVLSPPEIADELGRHQGLLDYEDPLQPGHHRSVARVMERSWGLLDPAVRQAMNRLSIFPAGFDLGAAKAVGGCDAAVLRRLSESSLIHRARGAYYQRHPLVRDYGRARLAEDGEAEADARRAHARFIRSRLEDVPRWERAESVSALASVEDEAANLLAAWSWAVESIDVDLIAVLADAMGRSLLRSGRHHDALVRFEAAFERVVADPANHRTAAMLLMQRVWLHVVLGDIDRAARLCDEAMAYDLRDDAELSLELTRARATIERHRGDVAAALDRLTAARPVIERASSRMRALVIEDMGDCQMVLGLFDDAVQSFDLALAMARKDGSAHGVVRSLLGLATSLLDAGRPAEALVHLREAAAVIDEADLAQLQPHVASKLAIGHLQLHDLVAAREAVALANERTDLLGEQWLVVELDLTSAQIDWFENRFQAATDHLERAIELAADIGDVPLLGRAFVALVQLTGAPATPGPVELKLLSGVAESIAADHVDRERARALLCEHGSSGSTPPPASGERGVDGDLIELVPAALAYLRRSDSERRAFESTSR